MELPTNRLKEIVGCANIFLMETKEIIRKAGGPLRVSQVIQRHHSTVCGWDKIPPCHARVISELSGVSVHIIRPDVFGPESSASHECGERAA